MIGLSSLPTHVARVASRLNVSGPDSSGDTFLLTSYLSEVLLKTIAVTLCAGLRHASAEQSYSVEYSLIRADGLGSWEAAISQIANGAYSAFTSQDLQPILAWLNKRRTRAEDDWAREAISHSAAVMKLLGSDAPDPSKETTVRHLISHLIQIRNKTKAHGAVGPDFFAVANPHYISVVRSLAECYPITVQWFYLRSYIGSNPTHVVRLTGTTPTALTRSEAEQFAVRDSGVYVRTHERGALLPCGDLLQTNHECTDFFIANGNYSNKQSEFIDYATGKSEKRPVSDYSRPPATLPVSATEGDSSLEIHSNVFGNLPLEPQDYVNRLSLQQELTNRLLDRNHAVITLHGRGGIGKTSLALRVVHELASVDSPRFEYIIWFSARDLELKPSGPVPVRRAIPNLKEVCKLSSRLLSIDPTEEAFAGVLRDPGSVLTTGLLFVFDNFETLDDPAGLHEFLDTYAHIPNKVLITSRERAFKADFPIQVGGMERSEAMELIRQNSQALGIAQVVSEQKAEEIFDYTEGHAYAIRVLLGEIAKEQTWVPLRSLASRRSDLISALFERSFNRLSDDGRRVFLTVANWRSLCSELALFSILGLRDIDVDAGLEECRRLSLITPYELADGHTCYAAPELTRIFGKKKLDGDPEKFLIHEDLEYLRQFGSIKPSEKGTLGREQIVKRFLDWCEKAQQAQQTDVQRLDRTLVAVAEHWPGAWLTLAKIREDIGAPQEDVAYALRRATEEMSYDREAWRTRASTALKHGDEKTYIASLVSAVEADPGDPTFVLTVADRLNKYVSTHKVDIPTSLRGVYLASVRGHMERLADRLDATGLSRLAWLHLLEGDRAGAKKYATRGVRKQSANEHCLNVLERLKRDDTFG